MWEPILRQVLDVAEAAMLSMASQQANQIKKGVAFLDILCCTVKVSVRLGTKLRTVRQVQ